MWSYILLLLLCSPSYSLFKQLFRPAIEPSVSPLHIRFLTGSQLPKEFYQPLLTDLEKELDKPVNISFMNYFPFDPVPNNTVLIGHSLGGFFALLYAIRDKVSDTNCIDGCVLINSHFNERRTMPYLGVPLQSVQQPTLVLLDRHDTKLPLEKALDDYSLSVQRKDRTKKFLVDNGTHISRFTNETERQKTVQQVVDYLELWNII